MIVRGSSRLVSYQILVKLANVFHNGDHLQFLLVGGWGGEPRCFGVIKGRNVLPKFFFVSCSSIQNLLRSLMVLSTGQLSRVDPRLQSVLFKDFPRNRTRAIKSQSKLWIQ